MWVLSKIRCRDAVAAVTTQHLAVTTFHRLAATCNKPALHLLPVPIVATEPDMPTASDNPPWGAPKPPVLEFKYHRCDAMKSQTRTFFLYNTRNVVAKWKIFHVGAGRAGAKKKEEEAKKALTISEIEQAKSIDDPSVFRFDIVEGTIFGPSHRARLLPTGPCLPIAHPHTDTEFYEPMQVRGAHLQKHRILRYVQAGT